MSMMGLWLQSTGVFAQHVKDTMLYRVTYKDTVIYRSFYKYKEEAMDKPFVEKQKKIKFNMDQIGIGPTLGVFYSPYNGFDINVGFGISYYISSIPAIRKPHKHRHSP